MADVLYIAITVAFFAISVAFVQLCDKVIGPDSEHGDLTERGEAEAPPEPDPHHSSTADPKPELTGAGR